MPELAINEDAAEQERLLRLSTDEQAFPLSFAQQRLWVLDQLEPNSPTYNIPTVLRLFGPLDTGRLGRALNSVVARHEPLRTTFHLGEAGPVQVIHSHTLIDLSVVDLCERPAQARAAEAEKLITTEIRRPFDLTAGPILRATVGRVEPNEHVLVLVIHHIASDEWSMGALFREWAEFYTALGEGCAAEVPELPTTYKEFARSQIDWVKSENYRTQLKYWRSRLRAVPTLQLPVEAFPETTKTDAGALCTSALSKELLMRAKALSLKERSTLFITLLAAFKVLLYRYTQQTDIVVGCPIAGRNRSETESLIGFFVNTLPLRSFLEPGISFREFLKQVREVTLGAFANSEVPFDKLVEELQPERRSTRTPLIQTAFSLNSPFIDKGMFPGVQAEEISAHTSTSKFDFTFTAMEGGDALSLAVEYKCDLFTDGWIRRMLLHYQRLVESIVANPDEKLSKLEIIPPSEKLQILKTFNRPPSDYPRHDPVHRLFECRAGRHPDLIALQYGEQTITYGELNARANQLANYLRQRGANVLVGVFMDRSVEMVIAFLAVLKSGAAYVPLDLSNPGERTAFMVEDAKISLILTEKRYRQQLPSVAVSTICLDAEWEDISRQSRHDLPHSAGADSLAYVIYTSGSTGQPKGVAVPHRGIARLVLSTDYVTIRPTDRIAQVSSASFDAATFEIWGALLNGAQVVGVSKEVALSPRDFSATLKAEGISILFVTTALLNQLVREEPTIFSSVDTVMFGGEAVDPKWVRAVLQHGPPKRLLHVYGPTENTTFSSWHLVTDVPEKAFTIPIGRPIASSELYILDPERNLVPFGTVGEIYVGGDGLAQGYWNRPDLTGARFLPHPFSTDAQAQLYRTGDLARMDASGNVEFIGRIDHQIKLRGFRIELGEIESVLTKHSQISGAVVMLREDTLGEKRLVAYLISLKLSADDVRTFLRSQLPDYMIPSTFVFMESFPLTPNEKIDRNALPAPEQSRSDLSRSFAPPENETERQLAQLWEKNLGVHPIGVTDNFFDLGGHSLLAVRIFLEGEKLFGQKLPLSLLFQAPTIRQIAAVLQQTSRPATFSTIIPIQPKGSRPPIFWVHSLGGDGAGAFFYYRKLSELLGSDQPSFGIRSPETPFSRIEDMARFYLTEIRRLQPNGPYYIGGFCFGGNVAFEMAQQLLAAGEEVGALIEIEAAPPNVRSRHSWNAATIRQKFDNLFETIKDFAIATAQEQLDLVKTKGKRLVQKARRKIAVASGHNGSPRELKDVMDISNYPEQYLKYAETHWRALTEYRPKQYPGEIILFRAKKQGLAHFSHTLGWAALVENRVQVVVVPGTHETILQEPNVEIVATKLRAILDAAESATTKTGRDHFLDENKTYRPERNL